MHSEQFSKRLGEPEPAKSFRKLPQESLIELLELNHSTRQGTEAGKLCSRWFFTDLAGQIQLRANRFDLVELSLKPVNALF